MPSTQTNKVYQFISSKGVIGYTVAPDSAIAKKKVSRKNKNSKISVFPADKTPEEIEFVENDESTES